MSILEHFDLNNHTAYARWRDWKLSAYPVDLSSISVDIKAPKNLSILEQGKIQALLDRYNMVIYRTTDQAETPQLALDMAQAFGLKSCDYNLSSDSQAVSHIQVQATGVQGRYIPYTSKPLSWHCDGYYNALHQKIRAFILHCARAAQSGGENALLDPEIAYIQLRDANPGFILALSANDVMTIPANTINGKIIRAEQTGPIFSFDADGNIHLRYSARKYNIRFKDDPLVTQAITALTTILTEPNDWQIHGKLSPGEGLLCNNVLHQRSAFTDSINHPRLLYRLRYYERIKTSYL